MRYVAVNLGQVAGDVMLVPELACRSTFESICRVLTGRGWGVPPSMCLAAGRHLLSGSLSSV